MSSIQIEFSPEDEVDELLERLHSLSGINTRGVMNALAESLRTSTIERFEKTESPDGKRWQPSKRAEETGGKTLTDTAVLKNSIRSQSSSSGLAVGTNDIRAATHQFGSSRTIRAKNGKYLTFKIGNRYVSVKKADVDIPARPFLGISNDDMEEIRNMIEGLFKE